MLLVARRRCPGRGAVCFAMSTAVRQVRGAAAVCGAFGTALAVLTSSRLVLVVWVLFLVDLSKSFGLLDERLLVLFVQFAWEENERLGVLREIFQGTASYFEMLQVSSTKTIRYFGVQSSDVSPTSH